MKKNDNLGSLRKVGEIPANTEVTILKEDPARGMVYVEANGQKFWIEKKYLIEDSEIN